MNRQSILLVVALAVGVVIGGMAFSRIWQPDGPGSPRPSGSPATAPAQLVEYASGEIGPEQLAEILESLTRTLNEEIRERRLLSEQLQQLQAEVAELRRGQVNIDDAASTSGIAPMQTLDERFSEMGFTREERDSIFQMQAAAQVRSVELDDIARREGWFGTQRYAEEMQALATFNNPVRQELGDDRFDRYLYAMGRPNRVVVGSTMQASQARKAGFQRGDVIVRYGGQPVFSNLELVNLRSSGNAGEPVIVDIMRNGQPMQLTIPRGPMGMGGSEQNIDPRTNTPD